MDFAIIAKTQNILEEKVDRVYTATNAVQKTSDYIVQDNEQQIV